MPGFVVDLCRKIWRIDDAEYQNLVAMLFVQRTLSVLGGGYSSMRQAKFAQRMARAINLSREYDYEILPNSLPGFPLRVAPKFISEDPEDSVLKPRLAIRIIS